MQFIFGDDWNDAPRSSRFCSFALESRPLILVYLHTRTQSIQKQIVEHDIKINILKKTRPSIK